MILYGLAGKSWLTGKRGGPDGLGLAQDQQDPSGPQDLTLAELPGSRRTTGGEPAMGAARPKGPGAAEPFEARGGYVDVMLRLTDASSGRPCPGALVELWRTPSGTGPSFRTGRKLSGSRPVPADDNGLLTLSVPRGDGVEIIARTKDDGPRKRHVLGALDDAPPEPIEIRLKRPALPLEIRVTDSASRPIPGASIRIVSMDARPGAESPRQGTLSSRTDGDGRSVLDGKVRKERWILLDAPGYSPQAVSLEGLQPNARIDAALPEETTLELEVVDQAGRALVDAVVELEFSLAGFVTRRTDKTDDGGRVTMGRLPADTPLRPVVTPKDSQPQTVEVLESGPGEILRATLHVVH